MSDSVPNLTPVYSSGYNRSFYRLFIYQLPMSGQCMNNLPITAPGQTRLAHHHDIHAGYKQLMLPETFAYQPLYPVPVYGSCQMFF